MLISVVKPKCSITVILQREAGQRSKLTQRGSGVLYSAVAYTSPIFYFLAYQLQNGETDKSYKTWWMVSISSLCFSVSTFWWVLCSRSLPVCVPLCVCPWTTDRERLNLTWNNSSLVWISYTRQVSFSSTTANLFRDALISRQRTAVDCFNRTMAKTLSTNIFRIWIYSKP